MAWMFHVQVLIKQDVRLCIDTCGLQLLFLNLKLWTWFPLEIRLMDTLTLHFYFHYVLLVFITSESIRFIIKVMKQLQNQHFSLIKSVNVDFTPLEPSEQLAIQGEERESGGKGVGYGVADEGRGGRECMDTGLIFVRYSLLPLSSIA